MNKEPMTLNNHPAHAPLTTRRLHQMRDILSKASAQRDGGDIGYAMSDAVKLIDEVLAGYGRGPVLYAAEETLAYAKMGELHLKCLSQPMGDAVIPLYAAPPVQVVPEPIKRNDADGWWMYKGRRVGGGCAEWYNRALDDCRAAMLQAGNSPITPDTWIPVSERMPDTMISVLVTGDWFRHAVSFWDGASWCDLDFEPPVTHWQPLPAAPQQEVK